MGMNSSNPSFSPTQTSVFYVVVVYGNVTPWSPGLQVVSALCFCMDLRPVKSHPNLGEVEKLEHQACLGRGWG